MSETSSKCVKCMGCGEPEYCDLCYRDMQEQRDDARAELAASPGVSVEELKKLLAKAEGFWDDLEDTKGVTGSGTVATRLWHSLHDAILLIEALALSPAQGG